MIPPSTTRLLMRGVPHVTVSGADERTDLDGLAKLDVEVGFLYTETPGGRNRYPRRGWIAEAASGLKRVSIHVCGSGARSLLKEGRLWDIVSKAQRIQVNGLIRPDEAESLCANYSCHTLITQLGGSSPFDEIYAPNHALLVDASGGRGLLPGRWSAPETNKPVGFAGGLSPSTLYSQLPLIRQVSKPGVWLDLETGLRIDDWFSIDLAAASLATVEFSYRNAEVVQ